MKNIILFSLLGVLTFACNKNNSSGTTATQAGIMSQPKTEPAPEVPPAPINYTTTVLEADLPSPRKEMAGDLDGINLTINYGSPAVKGRDLWGSLVAYNKVWRTGANEATRFTTDQDITINDQALPAGTYGLFSIPNADQWQVIFNSTSDQWGAYEYDSSKDVLRISAQPQSVESKTENLEFGLEGSQLILSWGNLRLPIEVAVAQADD